MPTLHKTRIVKTPPRKIDFSSNNTPDSTAVLAIRYGKSYNAAADLVGMTKHQVAYRLTWLRGQGVEISPKMWRESSMPRHEQTMCRLDRRFKLAQSILNDAKRLARQAAAQKKKYRKKK